MSSYSLSKKMGREMDKWGGERKQKARIAFLTKFHVTSCVLDILYRPFSFILGRTQQNDKPGR